MVFLIIENLLNTFVVYEARSENAVAIPEIAFHGHTFKYDCDFESEFSSKFSSIFPDKTLDKKIVLAFTKDALKKIDSLKKANQNGIYD